jgi:CubicO group peptidase (beta-lactamase class C family)
MFETTENLMARHIAEGGYDGCAVVVMQRGRFAFEHYAGNAIPVRADPRTQMAIPAAPATPDTRWPLASISKLYSVAAIMRLIEQGALTLNTPVAQVIPAFTGNEREYVRLRHLLTHTSGLPYESPEMEQRLRDQTPMSALIDECLRAELLFKPGTGHSYADYNTLLAAHMAETVTGEPFAKLVATLVLGPGKLLQTHFPPTPAHFPMMAHVRGPLAEDTPGAMYNSPYARELAHPAFGVVASASDLARFGTLFTPAGERILSRATVRAMTTDQTAGAPGDHVAISGRPVGVATPYGLGFMLQTRFTPAVMGDLTSMNAFGHGGASGCWLVVDPDYDLVVAFVSNSHVRLGRDAWSRRIQSVINSVFATLTA